MKWYLLLMFSIVGCNQKIPEEIKKPEIVFNTPKYSKYQVVCYKVSPFLRLACDGKGKISNYYHDFTYGTVIYSIDTKMGCDDTYVHESDVVPCK